MIDQYTIYDQDGIKIFWEPHNSQFVCENPSIKPRIRMKMRDHFEDYDDGHKQEIIAEFLKVVKRIIETGKIYV